MFVTAAVKKADFDVEFMQVRNRSVVLLKDERREQFWENRWRFVQALFMASMCRLTQSALASYVAMTWRHVCVEALLRKFFWQHFYYYLQLSKAFLDPADRILDDVDFSTRTILGFIETLPEHLRMLYLNTQILWRSSPRICCIYFLYAILVTTVVRWMFGSNLLKLETDKRTRETQCRANLIRVGEFSDSIAFEGGGFHEANRIHGIFKALLDAVFKLLFFQTLFQITETNFANACSILPSFVMAPLYFNGEVGMQEYLDVASSFRKSFDVVFGLASSTDKIATLSARLSRINEFLLHADAAANFIPVRDSVDQIVETGVFAIELRDVKLGAPYTSQTLAAVVNINVNFGEKILVKGRNGAGKSSLLRTVAGIWPACAGKVLLRKEVILLCVPQMTYIPYGESGPRSSLWDQVSYASSTCAVERQTGKKIPLLASILHDVGLSHLGEVSNEVEWMTHLSGGERQQLAFARLFLKLTMCQDVQKDVLILVDEATSCCSEDRESELYTSLLQRLCLLSRWAMVSVGHRDSLKKFHETVLEMSDQGLTAAALPGILELT